MTPHRRFAAAVPFVVAPLGLGAVLCLSACAHEGTQTTTTVTTAATAAPMMTDDQVAGMLVALDATSIQRARIAQDRAKDPRVRQLADRVVADGAKSSDDEDAILHRIDLTPSETRESVELAVDAGHIVEHLRSLSADAFDDAYLAAEIDAADRAVHTLDRTLIPSARLDDLRRLLLSVRDAADLRRLEAREIRALAARGISR